MNLERKKGSYGCVRRESWDTCTVCCMSKQTECDFYMKCSKWTDKCQPEDCAKCPEFNK